MGWAIMFLVLIALVIILSISLINWKIQIYKVIVQLNAILNRKTKKLVTVSLSDRRLEHLVEIINQIVSKDNIYLGEIQKKENELKENISCLSHDLRTPLTSIRGYLQLLSSAPDEKRAEYISALSGKALRLERLIDDFYQKYHINLQNAYPIKPLIKSGELTYKNGNVYISPSYIYVMNEILLKLV